MRSKKLNLRGNRLSELPELLTKLTNLIKLDLQENEIEKPPLEIINKGIKSIRDYFLQLKEGEDYIYEAKLIIVGGGGAGKTTLAKKIDNSDYQLQENQPSTEGIDVITWKFHLRIRISGNNKRDFMTIITDKIDNINDSYERIKYNKLTPCNCPTCNNKTEPHFYRLEKLLQRLANERCNVECEDSPYHEVNIFELIDQTVGKQNIDKENQRIVKIQAKRIDKLVLGQGDMDDRDINNGNYNENTEGDYISGDKSEQSRNLRVGDVGGDFNPTNSPIMSDNANTSTSSDSDTQKKKLNWGLSITIAAIIISASVSSLFNEEIRDFFNLNSPSETPEQSEKTPAN